MKQVILFLSDRADDYIIERFRLVQLACADVYFLYHQKGTDIPTSIKNFKYHAFSSSILHSLGFKPIGDSLLPGSNHFPLFDFYCENPSYDYYWLMEDDVFLNGSWDRFVKSFSCCTHDFVSSCIRRYDEDQKWYWWSTFCSPSGTVPSCEMLHSFNPLYRLSRRAVQYLYNCLRDGWSGHHEVLIPSLLYKGGFSMLDIGEIGSFVRSGSVPWMYIDKTWSHLPLSVQEYCPDTLYHPIKEKKGIPRKKNCVISAVGRGSLHREWLKGKEEPCFDLHLMVYDKSFSDFFSDADFITYRKGQKLKLLYFYLSCHPEYVDEYEYFFIPDDDILADADTINKLFYLMRKYSIEIGQPSLSESYCTYPHTLRDHMCILRYTNFVEMMVPCFSRNALKAVFRTFNAGKNGWGIEWHWPILIKSTCSDMAVIDDVCVVHTRPVRPFIGRMDCVMEMREYKKLHCLDGIIHEWGFIPSERALKSSCMLASDIRKNYQLQKNRLHDTAKTVVNLLRSTNISGYGVDGYAGAAMFLAEYSRLTEDVRFYDMAMSIMERENAALGYMKNNLEFYAGLSGFCWIVEYLAKRGFIQGNTDSIMEDVAAFVDSLVYSRLESMSVSQLMGVYFMYAAKLSNHSRTDVKLMAEENNLACEIRNKLNPECLQTASMYDACLSELRSDDAVVQVFSWMDKVYSSCLSNMFYVIKDAWNILCSLNMISGDVQKFRL